MVGKEIEILNFYHKGFVEDYLEEKNKIIYVGMVKVEKIYMKKVKVEIKIELLKLDVNIIHLLGIFIII